MADIKTLNKLAKLLGDGGPFNPDETFEKVNDLVDALIECGNTDKVFVNHDDHLGLLGELPEEFLDSSLEELDESRFADEIQIVLGQANVIIPLLERTPSDDDIDDINEDRAYRGANTSD